MTILELGIEDRFEFVQTRWPHSWGTQTVAMPADFTAATPVVRIPALVTDSVTLTDSHAICDYLNAEFGDFRLLAREGAARWRAKLGLAWSPSKKGDRHPAKKRGTGTSKTRSQSPFF